MDAEHDLTAIFERIVKAAPHANVMGAGLPPREFLNLYASLLEDGASVTIMTCHEPGTDPTL